MGSSPLTRGKPLTSAQPNTPHRLIPAHAGKTRIDLASRTGYRAHPRSRGENVDCVLHGDDLAGSSPLTRGKHHPQQTPRSRERLIPAHAGKTRGSLYSVLTVWAHPRSRGENGWPARNILPDEGSSPLTRGKHFPTCAFTAQIDQILETLELAVSSGSYSVWVACATDAPQDQVRSIGLVLPSSRGAS